MIERQVAILDTARVAQLLGHGLQAIVEITLDRQDDGAQQAFLWLFTWLISSESSEAS